MLRFGLGVVIGVLLAFAFVRYDFQLPAAIELPGKLQGNIISSAVEEDLYRVGGDPDVRRRALEVYFANRAADAAAFDAEAGHPFLNALARERARKEARQLLAMRSGFEAALQKPALRQILERDHGVSDEEALEAAMLVKALADKPFLAEWLKSAGAGVSPERLPATLQELAADRAVTAAAPTGRPK
jgi:hypothetical protein